jgi:hypothetical protein
LKSLIKYIIILVFITTAANAQNDGAGNTGLAFLKLGITSRAISLGEAVVSNTNDASATHYNPAALFNGSKINLVFMHNEQILGARTEFLAGKITGNKFAFGFSLNNTAVDDIEVREIPGQPLETFNAQNFAMGLSIGYKVNKELSLGITGKFLFEKIYVDNASGFAVDLGGLYSKEQLSLGLAISNLGSMSELRNQSTKLPVSVRGGGSYLLFIPGLTSALRIGVDGYKVLDGGKMHANAGAEFLYKDFLALRVGYQSGYENKSLTTGIGIKYKSVNLDYAFVPYKFSLGSSHTITLGTNF